MVPTTITTRELLLAIAVSPETLYEIQTNDTAKGQLPSVSVYTPQLGGVVGILCGAERAELIAIYNR